MGRDKTDETIEQDAHDGHDGHEEQDASTVRFAEPENTGVLRG